MSLQKMPKMDIICPEIDKIGTATVTWACPEFVYQPCQGGGDRVTRYWRF